MRVRDDEAGGATEPRYEGMSAVWALVSQWWPRCLLGRLPGESSNHKKCWKGRGGCWVTTSGAGAGCGLIFSRKHQALICTFIGIENNSYSYFITLCVGRIFQKKTLKEIQKF